MKDIEYEVIICVRAYDRIFHQVVNLVKAHPNTAAYEVMARDLDTVSSFGLEIALGDWVVELHNQNMLIDHLNLLIENLETTNEVSTILICSKTFNFRDKILLFLAKLLLNFEVSTFQLTSRASTREALISWNRRAFKNKVIRFAPNMQTNSFQGKTINLMTSTHYNNKKLFRIGIRSMVYTSMLPLRVVSVIALSSSAVSTLYSTYVLVVKYRESSAPGWASTNLILSLVSLVLFIVLAALCEYVYQLVGAIVQKSSTGIQNEVLNKKYSFRENENIRTIRQIER